MSGLAGSLDKALKGASGFKRAGGGRRLREAGDQDGDRDTVNSHQNVANPGTELGGSRRD